MGKPLYLSTTLPYVNADPHIGHALEFVRADTIARYRRLLGDEVFFNTGTDEHGQKIFEAAQSAGEDVQSYVDHYSEEFKKLGTSLNLSYDAFIRTTDERHIKAAQEIWKRCDAGGDIYKKSYEGLYCVGCERFLTEKELIGGKCPIHMKEPVPLKEENYFFRFSKYQDALMRYLSKDNAIVPAWRREEALQFVSGGLEDFSISREKARLSWGIPVPGDDSQVMYVWFDALTNYISTLGWPEDAHGDFAKFWEGGEVMQVAGKDQVRFQSIMWQAMLMSSGIKNTDTIVYNGFITSGGQKMSKSVGNVINPHELVDAFGTDATRYLLLRHVHAFEDSDVTMERFQEAYNADLANGIGNLSARIMTLAENHIEPVARPEPTGFDAAYVDALAKYDYPSAIATVWERIEKLDQRMTKEEPFKLVKSDPDKGQNVIKEMAIELYNIAWTLQPFMPATSDAIKSTVLANKKPATLFPRKD